MNIDEIIELELEGIIKTICDYTSDTFVRSYAKKLGEINYKKDPLLFMKLVERLIDWYELESDKIFTSPYTFNKEGHKKTMTLLKQMIELK